MEPARHSKAVLIGIAGPSGAGKSELARRLASALDAPIIALDSYYRDLGHLPVEERSRRNFDVPEALDAELLTAQLRSLSGGEEIRVPVYDFAHHLRTADVRPVKAVECAVIEGLFTLYWETVRSLLTLKVFVNATDSVCLHRRLERDVRERGRTPESVFEQYQTTVGPMARRYILPTAGHADLVIDGTGRIEDSVWTILAHLRSGSDKRKETSPGP